MRICPEPAPIFLEYRRYHHSNFNVTDMVARAIAGISELHQDEKVHSKVKDYDKLNFKKWRKEQKKAGNYEDSMSRIFSGWDNPSKYTQLPWTIKDEDKIAKWLGK